MRSTIALKSESQETRANSYNQFMAAAIHEIEPPMVSARTSSSVMSPVFKDSDSIVDS